jgi:transglutaminase-like putative cysteine protease
MLYAVTHRTSYAYGSAVPVSQHLAHLHPRETPRQQLLDFHLEIDPEPTVIAHRTDYYGNGAAYITVEGPHKSFAVTARSQLQIAPAAWPRAAETPPWERVREWGASDLLAPDSEPGEFLFNSPLIAIDPAYGDYAAASFPPGCPFLTGVIGLTGRIFRDFTFDSRATTVATPVAEVFRKRRGVCQDFAHLGIACLRSLGLPARYVSGYLETLPPPGRARLVGADASHAWFAAWCPGHGWIDADPTNNLLIGSRHITLGWGRDFSDVSPLRGIVMVGGSHRLTVSVDVMSLPGPEASPALTATAT